MDNNYWYRGTADALYQNLDWLKQSHEPYVVIASGDGIYKMDYGKVLEYHIDKKADITVVCKEMPQGADLSRFGAVKQMTMEESLILKKNPCRRMPIWCHAGSTLFADAS